MMRTKLLNEKPDIKGITVPGMPAGIMYQEWRPLTKEQNLMFFVNNSGSTFIWKQYDNYDFLLSDVYQSFLVKKKGIQSR